MVASMTPKGAPKGAKGAGCTLHSLRSFRCTLRAFLTPESTARSGDHDHFRC
jgi:hypothetical protein